MRIAIITFHRAYNCGAMLQAWALKTVLERMGHTVEFPVCNHVGEAERWQCEFFNPEKRGLGAVRSFIGRTLVNAMSIPNEDILQFRYKRFRKRNLKERNCTPAELGRYYDLVVIGSDQVWSAVHSGEDAPVFFGENIPGEVRTIVYAASYGDKPQGDTAIKRVVEAVERFPAVSVREPLAQRQLAQYADKDIRVTLDPTLLLDGDDYLPVTSRVESREEPYLFMYTLSTEPFFVNSARELARRLGVKCIIAPCYQYSRYGAPRGMTYGISPDRLLGYARNAKYVLAGSFHGTVMGVIFKKPFLSFRAQVDKYESRPANLLNMMGCGERLVNPEVSIDRMEELLRREVDEQAYEKLLNKRAESLEWLKAAVGA